MVFRCQCWPVHDAIQYQYKTDAQENILGVFTLADLIQATKNFNQSSKIGEGRFGSVHMGTIKSLEHPFNDIQVAVKRVKRGQKRIIFGDFKPSNILLDSHMTAKLSDFGFSKESPQEGRTNVSTSVVGTKGYAAPEYVKSGHLTSKIDIWSFGIFLEELITGGRPLAQENGENAGAGKSKLLIDPKLEGEYSKKSMRMVASIANKCLVKDPELRPGMSEVLKLIKEAIALQTKNHQLLKSKCWPYLATHVC